MTRSSTNAWVADRVSWESLRYANMESNLEMSISGPSNSYGPPTSCVIDSGPDNESDSSDSENSEEIGYYADSESTFSCEPPRERRFRVPDNGNDLLS